MGDGYQFVAIYEAPAVQNSPVALNLPNATIEVVDGPIRLTVIDFPKTFAKGPLGSAIPDAVEIVVGSSVRHIVIRVEHDIERGPPDVEISLNRIDMLRCIATAIYTPSLFGRELYRGGVVENGKGFGEVMVKPGGPVKLDINNLPSRIRDAEALIAKNHEIAEHLPLACRFYSRAMNSTSHDELIIYLWTALEIFPMKGSMKLGDIATFLSPMLKKEPAYLMKVLDIGPLYGMRGELVHKGHLSKKYKQNISENLKTLDGIVRCVVRHAAGLWYDGSLDHKFL